jgi:opacity protein-like surface antigen
MSKMKSVLAAVATVAWAGSPILAEDVTPVDVNSVTCADFSAMDAAGKLDVVHHVMSWINDSNNSIAAEKLIGKYSGTNEPMGKLTEEKMVIEVEGHCKDAAPDAGIMARLIEHT